MVWRIFIERQQKHANRLSLKESQRGVCTEGCGNFNGQVEQRIETRGVWTV